MPVPPNQTFLTAIDIGTLTGFVPFTVTQNAFDGANVATKLYYSYLPVAGDDMLEAFATGDVTNYTYTLKVYAGPAGAPTQINQGNQANNTPMQVDIVSFTPAGERVFFECITAASVRNPTNLQLRVARGQKQTILNNDQIINDSSPGFPAIVMNSIAVPKRYSLNFPAGEGLQVLYPSGILGVTDAFNTLASGPVIYNVAPTGLTVRAIPVMPDTHYTEALGSNRVDTFVALKIFGVGNSFAELFDVNGVVSGPLDLAADSFKDVQTQADRSTVIGIRGTEIRSVTNPGGISSVLVTVDATFSFIRNLVVLSDNTFLAGYFKAATVNYVKQFDFAGTLLTTTMLPGIVGLVVERLYADPNPAFFWVWSQSATLDIYTKFEINGASNPLETRSRMKFIQGISQEGVTALPTAYSGEDFSCVPGVLKLADVPPPSTCECVTVIPIGMPGIQSLSNAIPIGVGFEAGELDMLFGEQRFIIPHQQISASGAPQQFSITDEAMGLMVVTVFGDNIRWLISGENPTATDGNVAVGGTALIIANISNSKNFRFILAAGSATSEVCANFSRP